ncbi:tRNA (adenosine(37)-N6)-threonylcarbamoyltransferase complex dimerization subunit type 1 TsaB [Paenimyroides ceti]
MALILNIETATKKCSVALAKNGKLIAIKEIAEENFSHAEKLHVFIESLLKENAIDIKELNAVAVSKGPGSYTGLRIGVSAAKGLCYALEIPLIAIDTLEVIARQLVIEHDALIVPMIDARRMEVFARFYDADYKAVSETKAIIIDKDTFNHIDKKMYLIGDGAPKCKEILNTSKFLYCEEIIFPSANEMTAISYEKYQKSDIEDVAYFEPFYLKDFMLNK